MPKARGGIFNNLWDRSSEISPLGLVRCLENNGPLIYFRTVGLNLEGFCARPVLEGYVHPRFRHGTNLGNGG
jgi:hypothetical protein